MTTLSIIGPGRVGKTLGRVISRAGAADILDIYGRSVAGTQAAAAFIGAGTPVADQSALRAADIYLLSVPDDAIGACSAALAAMDRKPGAIVFHCSGALTSQAMIAVQAAGAMVASVHPVRSFADPQRVADDFAGTGCGIEGDAHAVAVLRALFEKIGARVFNIDPANKSLYHAAAVFASNYVVTLIDVAMQTYGSAGVAPADALALMAPLLRETADNAFRLGPAAALTGPVARGDLATVQRQQQALAASNPAHATLYAALALATSDLAQRMPAPMQIPASLHATSLAGTAGLP
jgi:predicted short-subunit dehydrogenase-like oxidoreductase (DUF2520 family)